MFISFATLILSMISLPSTCYATPSLATASGTDVTTSISVDSYLQSYSGNNEFVVNVENLRPTNPNLTIGECPVLTYSFSVTQDNIAYNFAVQYEIGGINYDTLQVTTFVRYFNFYLGLYDNTITSNLYLGDCNFKYNGGTQLLGDIYYTNSELYSTSRQNISGWQLNSSTLVSSFSFGFTIAFFPPTFNETSNADGYNTGYEIGYQNGLDDGRDIYGDEIYDNGFQEGREYGEQVGYAQGYDSALNQGATASIIFNGIISVGLLPVNVFLRILNFEVFGINIGAFVSSLLTILVIIVIIRMFLGGKGSSE